MGRLRAFPDIGRDTTLTPGAGAFPPPTASRARRAAGGGTARIQAKRALQVPRLESGPGMQTASIPHGLALNTFDSLNVKLPKVWAFSCSAKRSCGVSFHPLGPLDSRGPSGHNQHTNLQPLGHRRHCCSGCPQGCYTTGIFTQSIDVQQQHSLAMRHPVQQLALGPQPLQKRTWRGNR